MLLTLSPDQAFFRETTEKFLVQQMPPNEVRQLRDDPVGFDPGYWRRGADLGWTSLLVDEEHGGGTISGGAVVDLSLVAYEFGRHAGPGPLLPTNVVASTLGVHGAHPEVLGGLLAGTEIASWCAPAFSPGNGLGEPSVEIRRDGADFLVRGEVRPVESAGQANHLLVTCRDGSDLTQVLVEASSPGVSVAPMKTVDLTRRFGVVTFDDVRLDAASVVGAPGEASVDADRQLRHTLAVLNAEAVGAMQAAFDMTVEWAFDRYAFGRPLASYQALKHRFADMLTWLEGGHAINDAACVAVDEGSDEADELLSVAKAFIGQYGAELVQDCVQMHGGIGVTFEHDLHLFLRRFTVNRALAGTPAEHLRRIGAMLGPGVRAA
ncbi:MAG: acyl-CoA dehydrogenase family protein [Acidimicrobiales bacterium]